MPIYFHLSRWASVFYQAIQGQTQYTLFEMKREKDQIL